MLPERPSKPFSGIQRAAGLWKAQGSRAELRSAGFRPSLSQGGLRVRLLCVLAFAAGDPKFAALPVEAGWIRERTIVAHDLRAAIAAVEGNDEMIDLPARGAHLGRLAKTSYATKIVTLLLRVCA